MINMTDEQKFLFDLNGFLVLEDVIPAHECEQIKEQIFKMKFNPALLPEEARYVPGGHLAQLINPPKVVAALNTLLGPHVRMDYGYVIWREKGGRHPMDLHHGGPTPEPMFRYFNSNGNIYSGMLRVVYEFNDVEAGDGGTCFLPGSHKSNYNVPQNMVSLNKGEQSPFLHHITCKKGSAIIFTENVAHGGPMWQNEDKPRVSAFFSYNHLGMQFHKPGFNTAVVNSLTPEQQQYFRPIWMYDFENDKPNF
jgi:Phytanoyl-CoA dioxygenase (PhyH)